ncbi:unnamed protein product [Soboliphyme baturini]|uniref:Protein-tyrosine phosphatase n=1 Tax=Soboliphyme baturini TaxID=241478 RepID=A0A183J794_9BILA|nr:unnamed protein product [Soboliphyme baturini]
MSAILLQKARVTCVYWERKVFVMVSVAEGSTSASAEKPVNWMRELAASPCEVVMTKITSEFFRLPSRPKSKEVLNFLKNFKSKRNKNRYRDVPCLDKTRVVLRNTSSDYIHANWVKLPSLQCNYILTQAPLENTMTDFWEMVWQERVEIIICLAQVIEKGRQKLHEYWPMEAEDKMQRYGRFCVKNTGVTTKEAYWVSLLETMNTDTKEKRRVIHYLYLDWPDHRVLIRQVNKEINVKNLPPAAIIVHCSAGVGRSGTLVALQVLMKEIDKNMTPNIRDVVNEIRKQRAMGVQAIEQYVFLYRAVISYALSNCSMTINQKKEIYEQLDWLRESTTKSQCNLVSDDH